MPSPAAIDTVPYMLDRISSRADHLIIRLTKKYLDDSDDWRVYLSFIFDILPFLSNYAADITYVVTWIFSTVKVIIDDAHR